LIEEPTKKLKQTPLGMYRKNAHRCMNIFQFIYESTEVLT
jgi:hypothetical protein